MKSIQAILFIVLVFTSPFVFSLNKDSLSELASSENLNEILKANQRAEREEILKMACQQQIEEKNWPTSCFEWMEEGLKLNQLTDKKKAEWSFYLERYCFRLASKPKVVRADLISSKLWTKSKCSSLAKKFGSGFEE